MRIVLTVHQFLPDFSAGTEILTYSVATELQRRGHSVEVWTAFPDDRSLPDNERFDEYDYQGLRVRRFRHSYSTPFGASNVVEAEYYNPLVRDRFAAYLASVRPEVVHFFHLGRLSASPIEACQQAGIPTAFTATDFWFICPMNQLRLPDNSLCLGPDRQGVNCLRHVVEITQSEAIRAKVRAVPRWLLRRMIWGTQQPWWPEGTYSPLVAALAKRPVRIMRLMNCLDRVVVPTRLMYQFMINYGLVQAKLRLIPYGLNLASLENLPPKLPSDRLRVGFIGTLAEHKGAHLLLHAIRKLPVDAPVEVKVFGKQDEFPQYFSLLRQIADGDDRVMFRGTFANERIGDVFAELDVLAVPSIWYENTPLVVYSAQAARTPVIASNVGGLSEVIHHEENGLLFEMGNVEALAATIGRLISNNTLVGDLARRAKRPKSILQYVDELETLYDEIVDERARGS